MKECDLKLIALAIETEGSIQLTISRPHKKYPNIVETLPTIVLLSNSSLQLCKYIQQIARRNFPFHFSIRGERTYQVVLRGHNQIRIFLKEMIPYLISKRSHAEKVLKFLISRKGSPRGFTKKERKILYSLRQTGKKLPQWMKIFYEGGNKD